MLNSLSLYPFWRDTWGSFDPLAQAQLQPLAYDDCYQPKWYKAPDDADEILKAGAYLEFGLEITPGSIITHICHPPAIGNFNNPGFAFKITDMSMGIEVWDVPTPDMFVSNGGNIPGDLWGASADFIPGPFPWLFSGPYPVVGSGLFKVEFWNNSGAALRCNLIFGVQEVNQCKY